MTPIPAVTLAPTIAAASGNIRTPASMADSPLTACNHYNVLAATKAKCIQEGSRKCLILQKPHRQNGLFSRKILMYADTGKGYNKDNEQNNDSYVIPSVFNATPLECKGETSKTAGNGGGGDEIEFA
ncbi:hypothetical protein ACHAQI_011581 [Fusarium lateritium]